jgi:hypothetical protein
MSIRSSAGRVTREISLQNSDAILPLLHQVDNGRIARKTVECLLAPIKVRTYGRGGERLDGMEREPLAVERAETGHV